MKIYLAGAYSRREQLCELRDHLRRLGHTVTSRWLDTEWQHRPDQSPAAPPEYREKYAVIDLEDVRNAECVINFTERPDAKHGRRGGRHVEFGYALGLGKRCVVVGPRENLFHHLPGVEVYEHPGHLIDAMERADATPEPAGA